MDETRRTVLGLLGAPAALNTGAAQAPERTASFTSVKDHGAVGDGLADDTMALQAAIDSGSALYFPPGVYKTSATLNMVSPSSHGQSLRGAGAGSADGKGRGRTVIRPTARVSVALRIDGASFGSYLQNFGVEDLAFDMAAMADTAASAAIEQGRALDGRYGNVRVVNGGLNRRGWRFRGGAYATSARDCQCANVEFAGNGAGDRVTTITFDNPDIERVFARWALAITFHGGAIQAPFDPQRVLYLPPGTTPHGYPVNRAGLYLAEGSAIDDTVGFTSVGVDWERGAGYPATFDDGAHGRLACIAGLRLAPGCANACFINPQFSGMYLLDGGARTKVLGYQEAAADIDGRFKPIAAGRNTAAQPLPSGLFTAIDVGGQFAGFDSDHFAWDAKTLRLRILKTGTYLVSAQVQLRDLARGQMRLQVVMGEIHWYGPFVETSASGYAGATCSGLVANLRPGEAIQLRAWRNGAGPAVVSGAPGETWLTVIKV